jgi:hypothetical protein
MMNIMSNSQILDQMAPPTFSSIVRLPRHEPFSFGIAELGLEDGASVSPRCTQPGRWIRATAHSRS